MTITESKETDGFANETDKQASSEAHETMREQMKEGTQQIERVEIKNTPFVAVREGKNWYLTLGRYRLNEQPLKNRKEVENETKNVSWFRIMQIVRIICEDHYQTKLKEAKEEMFKQTADEIARQTQETE